MTSTPGQGTVFRIYLPAAQTNHLSDQETLPLPPQGETIEQQRHARIMIIDDEEEVTSLLAELLSHAGYNVCTHTSSREALELLSANAEPYDLILTDMTMPGMTGLELSKKILSQRPGLPIILMTGFSDQIDEQRIQEAGIREFLRKPLEQGPLLRSIRRILEEERDVATNH